MLTRSVHRWYVVLVCLLVLRVPSLVQPAGADQGLYAYVGTRILDGGLPYRDAWDQKPPAIHFIYAVMYGLWAHESVVAVTDFVIAGLVAWMLVHLGARLTGAPLAGGAAAALFLVLGDPSLTRLAGVRIRSQCETFIAAAITGALLIAVQCRGRAAESAMSGKARAATDVAAGGSIGLLLGIATVLKYNALAYAPVVLIAVWLARPALDRARLFGAVVAGTLAPIAAMVATFAAGGALGDLYQATIRYNLEYSGETYTGVASVVRYLVTFPINQARIDSIWTVGGLGCVTLIASAATGRLAPSTLLPLFWVAAAGLSIAINGSRGLPQYFVQAVPALSLAAGVAVSILWPARAVPFRARPFARAAGVLMVSVAAWRVTDFDKIPRNALHDLAYMSGRIPRSEHLARYGGRAVDKYVALSVWQLAQYLESRTSPSDRIYVFGFSPGVYVQAQRVSASRFFWSRPVLVGFNADAPGYGVRALVEELTAAQPAFVVLQIYDWAPPPGDSATFFHSEPQLSRWLYARYERLHELNDENYEIWARRR